MGTTVKRWDRNSPKKSDAPSPQRNETNDPLKAFINVTQKPDTILGAYIKETEGDKSKPIPYSMVPGDQNFTFLHGYQYKESSKLMFVFQKQDAWPNPLYMTIVTTIKEPDLILWHGVTDSDRVQDTLDKIESGIGALQNANSYLSWMTFWGTGDYWPMNRIPLVSSGWWLRQARLAVDKGVQSLRDAEIKAVPPNLIPVWQNQLRAFVPSIRLFT